MPIYEFTCDVCKRTEEVFQHKAKPSKYITCKCGARMRKIVSQVNTDLEQNVRFSNSMGVSPRQVKEAERLYPGSEYAPDGRLIIHSRKEKLERMKQRGYVEFE
jgi:putative FmdB family regulatory protein